MNALRLVVSRNGQRPEWVALPDGVLPADLAMVAGEPKADGCLELLAVIDGVARFYAWGGLGRKPNDLLNPDLPLLPPADGTAVRKAVQRCGCGDVGCGSVAVTIRRVGDVIEWTDARDRDRPVDLGPFRFDAAEYEAEVGAAHRHRPWESRPERVARLVTEAFWDMRGRRPRSFDWASAGWEEGSVAVSMTDHRPNPRAGQPAGPPLPGGDQPIEDDAFRTQHIGCFAIDPGLSDEDAAEAIANQVRTVEPERWRPPPAPGWYRGRSRHWWRGP